MYTFYYSIRRITWREEEKTSEGEGMATCAVVGEFTVVTINSKPCESHSSNSIHLTLKIPSIAFHVEYCHAPKISFLSSFFVLLLFGLSNYLKGCGRFCHSIAIEELTVVSSLLKLYHRL